MNLWIKSLFALFVTNAFNGVILEVMSETSREPIIFAGCDQFDGDFDECQLKKWGFTSEEQTNTLQNTSQYCCHRFDHFCVLDIYVKSKCKPKQPDFDDAIEWHEKDVVKGCNSLNFDPTKDNCNPLIIGSLPEYCSKYRFPKCFMFERNDNPNTTEDEPEDVILGHSKPQNSFRPLCLESVPILLCLMASLLIIF